MKDILIKSKINYNLKCNIYYGESKVLQYFGNMRHDSAILDAFTKVMYVTNHSGIWHTELTWYLLSATHQICLNWLEHVLGIHGFRIDHWSFCNLCEISKTIWLLYCDQLCLHFSPNKCFQLLLWHYGPIQACKV